MSVDDLVETPEEQKVKAIKEFERYIAVIVMNWAVFS